MSLNISNNYISMPQSTEDKSITVAILSDSSLGITIMGTIFNLAPLERTFHPLFKKKKIIKTDL